MEKIGNICKILSGTTPKSKVEEYWGGNNVWLTPADIKMNADVVSTSSRKITDKAIKETSLRTLPKGTVLISSRAPIGKVCIAGCDLYCNQGFKALVCSERLYNRYLYYALLYNRYKLQDSGRGATFKEISMGILKELKIPVPPMEVQEKIVKILDEAQNLIDKRKEQLKLMDKLTESVFYEMFGDPVKNEKGWDVKKLEDVIKIKSAEIEDEEYTNKSEVWLLNLDVIQNDSGEISEKKYIKFSELPVSKISFDDRYVLYSKLRPYLNKVVVPNDKGFATSELVPLLPNENITKIYLSQLLRSKPIVEYLNSHTSGAKMPRVVMKDFREMFIPIPTLSLQNEFAEKVETIEEQKKLLEKSLHLMEDNYNSLMQKAFKGELF